MRDGDFDVEEFFGPSSGSSTPTSGEPKADTGKANALIARILLTCAYYLDSDREGTDEASFFNVLFTLSTPSSATSAGNPYQVMFDSSAFIDNKFQSIHKNGSTKRRFGNWNEIANALLKRVLVLYLSGEMDIEQYKAAINEMIPLFKQSHGNPFGKASTSALLCTLEALCGKEETEMEAKAAKPLPIRTYERTMEDNDLRRLVNLLITRLVRSPFRGYLTSQPFGYHNPASQTAKSICQFLESTVLINEGNSADLISTIRDNISTSNTPEQTSGRYSMPTWLPNMFKGIMGDDGLAPQIAQALQLLKDIAPPPPVISPTAK